MKNIFTFFRIFFRLYEFEKLYGKITKENSDDWIMFTMPEYTPPIERKRCKAMMN
jgi:hypothetical protein